MCMSTLVSVASTMFYTAYICLEAIEILKGYNNKEYNEDNMLKAWNYIIKLEMAQKVPFHQTSYVTVPPNVAGWRRVALQMAPFAERIQMARDPCCEKAIMLDATSCQKIMKSSQSINNISFKSNSVSWDILLSLVGPSLIFSEKSVYIWAPVWISGTRLLW